MPDERREVFERLGKGQDAKAIQRERHQKAATPATPADKADPDAKTPAAPTAPAVTAESLGISDKEFNALKRAKIDPATLTVMPVSNRKAFVGHIANSVAELDRQYQATKQGKPAGNATGNAADPATDPQTDPASPASSASPETAPHDSQKTAETAKPAKEQKKQAPAGKPFDFKLGDDHRRTLSDIGGEELATTIEAAFKGVAADLVSHLMGQFGQDLTQNLQPLAGMNQFLLSRYEKREFNDAIKTVKGDPGFDKLGKPEIEAIRDKTGQLLRASQDPEYDIADAVRDAAKMLFNPDPNLIAQANLLRQRDAALSGSPDKGDRQKEAPKSLSRTEQARRAYAELQKGANPKDLQRAMAG